MQHATRNFPPYTMQLCCIQQLYATKLHRVWHALCFMSWLCIHTTVWWNVYSTTWITRKSLYASKMTIRHLKKSTVVAHSTVYSVGELLYIYMTLVSKWHTAKWCFTSECALQHPNLQYLSVYHTSIGCTPPDFDANTFLADLLVEPAMIQLTVHATTINVSNSIP